MLDLGVTPACSFWTLSAARARLNDDLADDIDDEARGVCLNVVARIRNEDMACAGDAGEQFVMEFKFEVLLEGIAWEAGVLKRAGEQDNGNVREGESVCKGFAAGA
jgi:hypothetical protein